MHVRSLLLSGLQQTFKTRASSRAKIKLTSRSKLAGWNEPASNNLLPTLHLNVMLIFPSSSGSQQTSSWITWLTSSLAKSCGIKLWKFFRVTLHYKYDSSVPPHSKGSIKVCSCGKLHFFWESSTTKQKSHLRRNEVNNTWQGSQIPCFLFATSLWELAENSAKAQTQPQCQLAQSVWVLAPAVHSTDHQHHWGINVSHLQSV